MTQATAAQRLSLIEAPDGHGVPDLAKGGQARPIVMVLGMHRSGTSLCSHVLSVLGVDMADQMFPAGSETPGFDNPRGHWERWEIVDFHDRILAHFNRGYLSPFHDLPLPAGWWADPEVAAIRREVVGFLVKRMGETRFGFKDPRTVRLLPLWHQIFDDLNLVPKFVLCLRNPAEVSRSLAARDGLDPAMDEYRWLIHMVDFFRYIGVHEFCTVEYEKWFDDPRENVTKLEKFLGLGWQQRQAEVDLALSAIVDPALRHDGPKRSNVRLVLARSLYKLAARADHDAVAREQVEQITTQFREFQQSETPLENAFERASAAAARLPETERQVAELRAALADRDAAVQAGQAALAAAAAGLQRAEEETAGLRAELAAREAGLARAEADAADSRTALDERDAALASAGERAGAAEAHLVEALAEIEGERSRLAEIERERDERAAALAAAQAELAAAQAAIGVRDAALAGTGERAGAAEARLAAAQAAIGERDAALQRAETDATDLRIALGERDAALQRAETDATDLRIALAERDAALQQAERQISERDAAIAMLQNELAAVRTALAQAENQVNRRARASAGMEADIDGLRRSVASLEHEAEERTAAATLTQAELVSLRDELAAARQVGRSLLAALRTGPVLAPATDQLVGQPQGIFRLIRRWTGRARR